MSDVTIVIPFLSDSPERERNLKIVSERISSLGIPCIIFEQLREESKGTMVVGDGLLYDSIQDEGHFQKSKIINKAAQLCSTKYIWIHDCDVVLAFDEIIKKIDSQNVIKPFHTIFHLDEEDTETFISSKDFELKPNSPNSDYCGKYSLIINLDLFWDIGGFDERFVGWGWEDLDFVHNRIPKVPNIEIDEMSTMGGYHLHHPDAPRENQRKNFYIYKENGGRLKELSFCIHIKNRASQLKQTLRKNLNDNAGLKDKIEFVLVDFASSDGISEWVISNFREELEEEYLKLYKVFDFPYWHASTAKNTSHYLGESKILVNLDCDNFTGPNGGGMLLDLYKDKEVMAVHQFCQKEWFSGNYGRISMRAKVFDELGGYNESFYHMTYQDKDIIERAKKMYPDGFRLEPNLKYNKAIKNTKEESIANIPLDIKEKGIEWMHAENKALSEDSIKKNMLTANDGVYGIRSDVKVYNIEANTYDDFLS